jgi:leukotriene-A4 hydrolase
MNVITKLNRIVFGASTARRYYSNNIMKRPAEHPERDPSTLSNYSNFCLNKTDISLKINWTKQALRGLVGFSLQKKVADVSQFVLDSSFVNVHKVWLNGEPVEDFKIAERQEPLGSALTIIPKQGISDSGDNLLQIEFETTKYCTALQWLTPEQTAGKKAPYLFSQCQAIHARSLFPCFDTPAVKSKYNITIQSEHPVVSSGNTTEDEKTCPQVFDKQDTAAQVYKFVQAIPIPSYLFAIASGDLSSASIGPRSLVYSEPSKLDSCQHEFEADTENFIKTAESIVFPYDWKTFNVLVLPPSFPYGGMENPNITFATPTLISGDRQNVDVIAHELAHSWSGNLVTNCSWEHFWLNEGWTVYLERRIVGALHGEPYRHFSAIVGWKDLENAVANFGKEDEKYTQLVVDLKAQQDPDDAFSTVPYEKGSTFLFYLENLLGGKPVFDPFIPFYFTKFKGKSLDSYQFKDTLYEYFTDKKNVLDSIDWDSWFFAPGLPPKPDFDTSVADACYKLSNRWVEALSDSKKMDDYAKDFSSKDIEFWTSTQAVVFLNTVADEFEKSLVNTEEAVKALNEVYSFASSSNAEVISRWYRLAGNAKLESEYTKLANWLGTVGRMKFVRPGFRVLKSVDVKLAQETFQKNKDFYHPICRALVEKDLKT